MNHWVVLNDRFYCSLYNTSYLKWWMSIHKQQYCALPIMGIFNYMHIMLCIKQQPIRRQWSAAHTMIQWLQCKPLQWRVATASCSWLAFVSTSSICCLLCFWLLSLIRETLYSYLPCSSRTEIVLAMLVHVIFTTVASIHTLWTIISTQRGITLFELLDNIGMARE